MQCTTSKAGKRAKGMAKGRNTPKERGRSAPPAPSGHDETHHERSTRHCAPVPYFKNMFRFCPFLSPKIPIKHKRKKINVYFCHFLP